MQNKAHILIVDDEETIRTALSRHFRIKGFSVDVAKDGKEALELLSKSVYQVVISDIVMPVMDGIDLLRHIREEYPMTRVIMITGYVTLENALACLRHGADTAIFKPLTDLTELDLAVDKAVKYLKHWEEKLLALRGLKKDG